MLGCLEQEERSGLVRLVLGALGSEGQASLGAQDLGERIRAKADSTRAPSFTGTLVAIDSLSLVCPDDPLRWPPIDPRDPSFVQDRAVLTTVIREEGRWRCVPAVRTAVTRDSR